MPFNKPVNPPLNPVRCQAQHGLNDELQCQHACAHSERCGPVQAKAATPVPAYRAGSIDLEGDNSGWLFDTTWTDWAGAVVVLIIMGVICGYAQ